MILNGAHIPAIQALGGRMRIVAVCDHRKEAAEFTAAKLGVPAYTDPETMLKSVPCDILVNCTPNADHTPLTLLGIEHGVHVITEKPVSLKYNDVVSILAAADAKGVRFYPTQTGRFTNPYLTAKRWIDEGQLGKVYLIDMQNIRTRGVPNWGEFHIKERNMGGAFADVAVHMVDAVLDFLGNPALISAQTSMVSFISHSGETVQQSIRESGAHAGTFVPQPFSMDDMNVEEFAVGMIRLAGDVTFSFRVAWALNLPKEDTLRIAGDKGGLVLPEMKLYKTYAGHQAEIAPKVFDNTSNAVPGWGHWVCYERILDDLDGKAPYPVTREEMLNTAAILEAVYRSAELGREVRAEEILGK
jgi:predicted dehydrogenase